MNNSFYGTKKAVYNYLVSLEKVISCEDPEELSILNSLTFDEEEIVCVCTTAEKFYKIRKIFDGKMFCYEKIEDAKHITPKLILNMVLKKYQLTVSDEIKDKLIELAELENFNSVVYKYSVLKDIDLISKITGKMDTDVIPYLRSLYYQLASWQKRKFSSELGRYNDSVYRFLKYLVLSSEMSFRKTGLSCYPYYIQCVMKKISKQL